MPENHQRISEFLHEAILCIRKSPIHSVTHISELMNMCTNQPVFTDVSLFSNTALNLKDSKVRV